MTGEVPVEEVSLGLPWPSHMFWSIPDAEVDDAQEGSWSRSFMGLDLLSG
jgi:hypothetical protein